MKRLAILLLELATEALMLSVLLGGLFVIRGAKVMVIWGSILALPVVLALKGYYLSRLLATLGWLSRAVSVYPCLAATAFLAHTSYIAVEMWPEVTPQAKEITGPFIVGGICIVFACAFTERKFALETPATSHRHDA